MILFPVGAVGYAWLGVPGIFFFALVDPITLPKPAISTPKPTIHGTHSMGTRINLPKPRMERVSTAAPIDCKMPRKMMCVPKNIRRKSPRLLSTLKTTNSQWRLLLAIKYAAKKPTITLAAIVSKVRFS